MSTDVIQAPELAPGCFGSALAFSKTDMVCNACPFSVRCEPAHDQAKAMLKARFGIGFKTPKPPAPPTAPVTPMADAGELTVDKRSEALLKWIEAMQVGVHDKLKAGINPFGDKTKFMAVICNLLLLRPKVTKQMMMVALMATLKCEERTADASVRTAIKTLIHLGVITDKDGVFALRRS